MDNEVKIQFKNSITGETKLEKYKQTLTQIYSIVNEMQKGGTKELETSSAYTIQISKDVNDMAKRNKAAFSYTTLRTFTRGLQNLTKAMASNVAQSSTYYENMNLLQVAFKGDTKEADKFVNKLSEMYGLDESWGYRTVGIFKQLSNAMGLANDIGTKLSTTMTQFAIDVSSLYNIDTNDAVSILTSALAGQTKPARRLGADITQSTLQQTLNQQGIQKSISNLTYAEKRLVIVTSLLNQVSEATNDWGKTIESPANQTRILSEQWDRLTRTIGNIFLPIVYKILPYVNAILMVLTEIAQIIANIVATFLGFSEEDLNFGAGVSEEVVDFTDSLNSAADSVDNLKDKMSGLRSFDKLINVTASKKTGTSGISGTGVSADILNMANKAMDEYNKKLENVQMKATKIRDNIMEWLGFTKEIDEETGDVSFKFDHITSGTVLGALAVGGSIFTGVMKILKFLNQFGIIGSGSSSLFANLFSGGTSGTFASLINKIPIIAVIIGEIQAIATDKKLHKYIREIEETLREINIDFNRIFDVFKTISNAFNNEWKKFIDFLSLINEDLAVIIRTKLRVIIDLIHGDLKQAFIDFGQGLKDVADNTFSFLNKAFSFFNKDIEEKINEVFLNTVDNASEHIIDKFNDVSNEFRNAASQESDVITVLQDKLLSLVDSNGKVKDSDKAVTEYILKELNSALGTEYKLQGNIIELNGKQIKSNKDLEKSIENIIKQKKIQILLDAYKEDYVKALKEQKSQQKEINELEALYAMYEQDSTEEGKIKRDVIMSQLDDTKKKMSDNQKAIKDYDELIKASTTNNIEQIDNTLKKYGIEVEKSVSQSYQNLNYKAEEVAKNTSKLLSNIDFKWTLDFETKKAQASLTNLASNFLSSFQTNPLFAVIKSFNSMFKANGGIYSGGQWHNIARYDGGGMPQTGQLFWARENGLPEMVGQIGGHTAVMNNDQIVGSVANGVYRAVREANAQTQTSSSGIRQIDIYLDKNHKLASYTLEELQSMAKSNGKSISIS